MRVLVVTNIFPNAAQPRSAPFNRQQFAALGRLCEVEVLATIPWFPAQRWLATQSEHAIGTNVPRRERIDGLEVHHPRTLHIPKIGGAVAAPLFAASLVPSMRRYRGRVDVLLGSWAYPDGCAAVLLASLLGVPAVVKLHGSDLNVVAKLAGPRRYLRALLPRAAAVVSVSRALSREAEALGVDPTRIHQVMNGVDPEIFQVRDRQAARERLGIPGAQKMLLCVGNLKESKGVVDLRDAFLDVATDNPDLHLYMVGDGAKRGELEESAQYCKALHIVGPRPHSEIPAWLSACDLLVLPSWNEGTPNVVLEALACGRRVVATAVGGVPDLLDQGALGALVAPRAPQELARALETEIRVSYDPVEIARKGARGDWTESARNLLAVLEDAVAR